MNKLIKIIKTILIERKRDLYYLLYKVNGNDYHLNTQIMTIDDTLDFISIPGNSMVRYGDGEFMLMRGGNIGRYQSTDKDLAAKLQSIIELNIPNLLICLPETFLSVEQFVRRSQWYWIYHNKETRNIYQEIINANRLYGNSFVSRPYMIYRDKTQSSKWFRKLIKIFDDQDILLVEGEYSRTGVGNDLFSKAKSIKRIICPPNNAYNCYDEIFEKTKKHINKSQLVLVALGPTGKVLTADLVKEGYWVLDIGHIDSEYEWFIRKATRKVAINNKHSAEMKDDLIGNCTDPSYISSIVELIQDKKDM